VYVNHRRAILTEIAAVFAVLVLARSLTSLVPESPIRVTLAIVLVAFLPGYALSTFIFPAQRSRRIKWECIKSAAASKPARAGLTTVERLAVSFALSLTIGPIVGLILPASGLSFEPTVVLDALSLAVIIFSGLGIVRRLSIPKDDRYVPNFGAWADTVGQEISSDSPVDLVLNAILVVTIVLAASSLTFALVAPQNGSSYTSTYLLSEDGEGQLAATNWPRNFTRGEREQLTLVVENHEHARIKYFVVLELHRIGDGGTVAEERTLNRYQKRVKPSRQWRIRHEVAPMMTGSRLQLVYLIYKRKPPTNPMKANAYRHLSIGITVSSDRETPP
jgi:uncharacterized membrane protein